VKHRLFAWIGLLRCRPRSLRIALASVALLLLGASPFLWAGYHWYAGRAALDRYHGAEAR
jgi:hypothetical protein